MAFTLQNENNNYNHRGSAGMNIPVKLVLRIATKTAIGIFLTLKITTVSLYIFKTQGHATII